LITEGFVISTIIYNHYHNYPLLHNISLHNISLLHNIITQTQRNSDPYGR